MLSCSHQYLWPLLLHWMEEKVCGENPNMWRRNHICFDVFLPQQRLGKYSWPLRGSTTAPTILLRMLVLQYLQMNSEKFKVWYYTKPLWLLLNLFSVLLGKDKRHKHLPPGQKTPYFFSLISYILKTWLVLILKCLIWSFPLFLGLPWWLTW